MLTRPRATGLLLALLAALALPLAACGGEEGVTDPAPETTQAEDNPYRLTVSSSRGSTDAVRASVCGQASSPLVELPCGVSLGFARNNASRLYVARERDRIFLELERPAAAIFTSLAQADGERGLMRRSAFTQLGERGHKASIGLGPATEDLPTVKQPSFLSVLIVYKDEMPAPQPAPSGAPDDAVVANATAEFLVELATRRQADEG